MIVTRPASVESTPIRESRGLSDATKSTCSIPRHHSRCECSESSSAFTSWEVLLVQHAGSAVVRPFPSCVAVRACLAVCPGSGDAYKPEYDVQSPHRSPLHLHLQLSSCNRHHAQPVEAAEGWQAPQHRGAG